MKTPQDFSNELKRRFTQMCLASKEGYKASPTERHRLEGFIQAGVYVGLIDNSSAKKTLETVYQDIFQEPMSTAAKPNASNWRLELRDYSLYDTPAYLRAPE